MNTRNTLFLTLLLILSMATWGSGGEAHAHAFDWTAFLGKVFNSTILFGGLIYALRKPLIRLLSEQSSQVRLDIEERRGQIKSATADYESLRKRLDDLEREIREISDQARENGERERLRIEAEGKAEAERIARLTEEEIGNRVDAAVRRLKSRVAEMAIQRFRDDIRDQLDAERHSRIIDRNIEISGDVIGSK